MLDVPYAHRPSVISETPDREREGAMLLGSE